TAIRTSAGPGVGFGTVATVNPGARRSFTMACMRARITRMKRLENRPRVAAVYLQHRAGNIAGPVRGQKTHGRSQFFRISHASHGDVRDDILGDFFRRAPLTLRPGA